VKSATGSDVDRWDRTNVCPTVRPSHLVPFKRCVITQNWKFKKKSYSCWHNSGRTINFGFLLWAIYTTLIIFTLYNFQWMNDKWTRNHLEGSGHGLNSQDGLCPSLASTREPPKYQQSRSVCCCCTGLHGLMSKSASSFILSSMRTRPNSDGNQNVIFTRFSTDISARARYLYAIPPQRDSPGKVSTYAYCSLLSAIANWPRG
jgi:hypothetical protein